MSSVYDLRASQHRPADVGLLDAEIRRLRANGLTPRDIAAALRLPPDTVINALRTCGLVETDQF